MLNSLIDEIIDNELFNEENISKLLSITDSEDMTHLFRKAYEIKTKHVGRKVFLRGLIELSDICRKNCYYCEIRRDNLNVNSQAYIIEQR